MMKVANAPCSWGVLEFDLEGEAAGCSQVLDEIKASGYAGTELGDLGFMPTDPEALSKELCARDLDLVGAFVPVTLKDIDEHEDGIRIGIKTAKLMADAGFGDAMIVLADNNGTIPSRTNNAGRVTPNLMLDSDGWENATKGASNFARRVFDETGLRTVFHHHCAGFVEAPGEVEKLLMSTPEDVLGLVLDMGHYSFAGGYPEAAIELFWDRIWHVHFKDCSADVAARSRKEGWNYFESVQNGVFCELGNGCVDFEAIAQTLKKKEYDGWIVVEQDVLPGMGSPLEAAKRNRDFIAKLGF